MSRIEDIKYRLREIENRAEDHGKECLREREELRRSMELVEEYFDDQDSGKAILRYLSEAYSKLGYAEAHCRDVYFGAEEIVSRYSE